MAKLVSKAYGDALFETAIEKELVDQLYDEVCSLQEIFQTHEQLLQLLNHPKITSDEKTEVMENIFNGKICDELMGFLIIIVNKGRYNDISSICDYFIVAVKEYRNIGIAYISSAIPLTDEQKLGIKEKLMDTTTYKEMEFNYLVDPTLIGGMVIRIKDRVVDSSVRTKLYDLSKDLSKIQLA